MNLFGRVGRRWRARRRELAFQQLQNPSGLDHGSADEAARDAENLWSSRAEGSLFRRATRAQTRSEWRGD